MHANDRAVVPHAEQQAHLTAEGRRRHPPRQPQAERGQLRASSGEPRARAPDETGCPAQAGRQEKAGARPLPPSRVLFRPQEVG